MGIIFPLGFLCQRAAEPGANRSTPAGALPAHCRPRKVVSKPPGAFSSQGTTERHSPGGAGSHEELCGKLVTGDALLLMRCRRGCRHPPPRLPKGTGSTAAPAAFPGYWSNGRPTPVLLHISLSEHQACPCPSEEMRGAGWGAGLQATSLTLLAPGSGYCRMEEPITIPTAQ